MRALLPVLLLLTACPGGTGAVDTEADSDTAPASTFACHDIECDAGEICVIGVGGAPPPPGEDGITASCQPAPMACEADPTCDCAADADVCPTGPSDCDDTDGTVTCTIYYP